MKIKILGTGNAFNLQARLNSSFLLDIDEKIILVDCGFTVPFALQKENISYSSVDYIFVTHYHGDHYAGLASFILALKHVSKQYKPLNIVGPGNVKAKVVELMSVLYPGSSSLVEKLNINFLSVPVNGGSIKLCKFEVDIYKMIHSEASLPVGYIFKINNFKLGFSGDTSWHTGIPLFVNRCDKIILECNFSERLGESHISVDELEASSEIQLKKKDIYLTHLHEDSSYRARNLGYNTLSDSDELYFKT
jgi:ribonuclease BN (tRNA processing enzyme)